MLIYGGPTWAFTDTWQPLEVGWNALLLAEQGYVVAMPSTRGSSSCIDISHCLQYITSNLTYADTSRTIALGFSYGGYLLFYLAGLPHISTSFKALAIHAGTFSNPGLAASDVPDLMGVLFGGPQSSSPSPSPSAPRKEQGFNLIHALQNGDPSSPKSTSPQLENTDADLRGRAGPSRAMYAGDGGICGSAVRWGGESVAGVSGRGTFDCETGE
ncbi:MAG: hypothetical protein Q9160_000970 [Pyrenula sp. 1 TL-2023]